jgi:hypothetical protein
VDRKKAPLNWKPSAKTNGKPRKEREEKIRQSKAAKSRSYDPKGTTEKRAEAPKYNLEPPQKRTGAKLVKKNTASSPVLKKKPAGKAAAIPDTAGAKPTPNITPQTPNDQMPLNKYIAHGGFVLEEMQ